MKINSSHALLGAALLAASACGSAATTVEQGIDNQVSVIASDQGLARRVEGALERAPYLYSDHILVTSKHGVVTLDGQVSSALDLLDALTVSSRVEGVVSVIDDLTIWDFGGSSGR